MNVCVCVCLRVCVVVCHYLSLPFQAMIHSLSEKKRFEVVKSVMHDDFVIKYKNRFSNIKIHHRL